jgi:hypothetical protein
VLDSLTAVRARDSEVLVTMSSWHSSGSLHPPPAVELRQDGATPVEPKASGR